MVNKKNLILLFFVVMVVFIPFLEFIEYNFNNTSNGKIDLKINFLTIKRLSILYVVFILSFFIILFILKKKTKLKKFDIIVYLSFIYWMLFKYNEIKKIFNLEFLSNYVGELSFFIILFVIIVFTKFFLKKKTNFINNFISIFFILNFIFLISEILTKKNIINKSVQNNFKFEKIDIKSLDRKNIYFIILDAMPPIEIADKTLGTKSINFLNKLKKKGYRYIENSKSFYGNTYFTIGSIFNFKPFEGVEKKIAYSFNELKYPELTFPSLLRKKNTSNLEYNLNSLGYEIKWIGNHFSNCYGYNRQYCIDNLENSNFIFNYETLSFLKKTAFYPIIHNISKILDLNIEQKIIFKSNNAINKLEKYLAQNGKPIKPTFIFVHHLISHWPYLVDSNCNYEKNPGKTNKIGIKNSIECNKKLISKVTDTISIIDNDAIVIFQSDHNWELSNIDPEKYGNRKNIFNLIKLNDFCKDYEVYSKENINIAKIIIHCASNTEPKFLKFNEN